MKVQVGLLGNIPASTEKRLPKNPELNQIFSTGNYIEVTPLWSNFWFDDQKNWRTH